MMTLLTPKNTGTTEYFQKGSNPRLLILSGMHGDESGVITSIQTYLEKNLETVPDFLFVPEVSPSAVAAGTRKNSAGRDINRHFLNQTDDAEVKQIMEILRPYTFDLCLEFHEDPDRTKSFYVYDSEQMAAGEIKEYEQTILQSGASLYTGIDDPLDADLGLHIHRGYIATPIWWLTPEAGFSIWWLLHEGKAKRVINPEVPGKAKKEIKDKLVEQTFAFFLR